MGIRPFKTSVHSSRHHQALRASNFFFSPFNEIWVSTTLCSCCWHASSSSRESSRRHSYCLTHTVSSHTHCAALLRIPRVIVYVVGLYGYPRFAGCRLFWRWVCSFQWCVVLVLTICYHCKAPTSTCSPPLKMNESVSRIVYICS